MPLPKILTLSTSEIEAGCVATHFAAKSWVDDLGVEHNKYKSSLFLPYKTKGGRNLYRNAGASTPDTEVLEHAVAAGRQLAEQYQIPYHEAVASLHNKPVPERRVEPAAMGQRLLRLRPSCLGGDA